MSRTDGYERVAVLWSGGYDSTTMVYLLASQLFQVKPYHFVLRKGGGKDARETEAVDYIWDYMRESYPNVEKPSHIKYAIGACDDRNRKMIEFLRDNFGEKKIAIGSYVEGSGFPGDNDHLLLSRSTGCEIVTFDTVGIKDKLGISHIASSIGIENIINETWSCQLFYKTQCFESIKRKNRMCFSCKERQYIMNHG